MEANLKFGYWEKGNQLEKEMRELEEKLFQIMPKMDLDRRTRHMKILS